MRDLIGRCKVFGIVSFITGTVWVAAWERGLYAQAHRGYLPPQAASASAVPRCPLQQADNVAELDLTE